MNEPFVLKVNVDAQKSRMQLDLTIDNMVTWFKVSVNKHNRVCNSSGFCQRPLTDSHTLLIMSGTV